MKKTVCVVLFFCFISNLSFAQILLPQQAQSLPNSSDYKMTLPGYSETKPATEEEKTTLKSPELAGFLSFILPGAGHAYNGDWIKAGLNLASFVGGFLGGAIAALRGDESSKAVFEVWTLWSWFKLGVYDSYMDAVENNRRYEAKWGLGHGN